MWQKTASWLWLVGVSPLILAAAAEGSTFRASVIDAAAGALPICEPLGPSPASGTWENNTSGTGSSSATAAAAASGLGGTAIATSMGETSASNSNRACFGAEVVIDDVTISGPGPTATIQVSADIAGLVDLFGDGGTNATATIYASIEVGEDSGSGIVYSTAVLYQPSFLATTSTTFSTTLTSLPLEVSTSSTIAVRLFLAGSVLGKDNHAPGSASASLDLTDGMGFPAMGPVFILPAGFTANSVDANIVDNQLGAPPAVPALTGWSGAILGLVLAGLGLKGCQAGCPAADAQSTALRRRRSKAGVSHGPRNSSGVVPSSATLASTNGWMLVDGEWQWPSAKYATAPSPCSRTYPSGRVLPSGSTEVSAS